MNEIEQASIALERAVTACEACPRLRQWCETVAREKTKRYAEEEYWGKPVPSFGPLDARLLIVGLAPAAQGANRTGRMFTGDRSGEWLFGALHRFGFSSRAESAGRGDGLELIDARITAVAHCAPPQNKLTAGEIRACSMHLAAELRVCTHVRVYLALGATAYAQCLAHLAPDTKRNAPPFAHGVEMHLPGGALLLASYHPSQQNTFTGRLTQPMFDRVFDRASREIRKNSYISPME